MWIPHIFLGLFIVIVELTRKKYFLVDLLTIINLVTFISFVIVPLVLPTMLLDSNYSSSVDVWAPREITQEENIQAGLLAFLFYSVFITAFSLTSSKMKLRFFHFAFGPDNIKNAYRVGVLLLGFAVVALSILVISEGGISDFFKTRSRLYFSSDQNIRQGTSPVAFLSNFLPLSLFASFLLWGIKKDSLLPQKKILVSTLFYLAFFLSILMCFTRGGRFLLFMYIATFPLASSVMQKKKGKVSGKILLIAVAAVLIMIYGDALFRMLVYDYDLALGLALNNPNNKSVYAFYTFLSNFAFPYLDTIRNIRYPYDHHFFEDLVLFPFYYVPRQLIFIDLPSTSTEINTLRVHGSFDKGGMPTDILSYGLINAGVVGIVMCSFLFGLLVKTVNNFLTSINSYSSAILYSGFIIIVGFFVIYFDPHHFIRPYFYFWFGLGCLYVSRRFNWSNK